MSLSFGVSISVTVIQSLYIRNLAIKEDTQAPVGSAKMSVTLSNNLLHFGLVFLNCVGWA